jgi:hypothetical protein
VRVIYITINKRILSFCLHWTNSGKRWKLLTCHDSPLLSEAAELLLAIFPLILINGLKGGRRSGQRHYRIPENSKLESQFTKECVHLHKLSLMPIELAWRVVQLVNDEKYQMQLRNKSNAFLYYPWIYYTLTTAL